MLGRLRLAALAGGGAAALTSTALLEAKEKPARADRLVRPS